MNYQNPIIRGFSPDPSIIRVENDYYLVTSSFEYFPGIPIYHSTDLVNWEQIGNCISWENPVSLKHTCESGGIWAPTIRYDNGLFYVTAAIENYGNFIIHASNPKGPWSEPVWVPIGGIDPSLFFENGKTYYCTTDRLDKSEEGIALGVVNPLTAEIMEPFQIIWNGTGGGCLESPHVYHIGEWYYILTAEGGTFYCHMITVGRSKNIWGPYEVCPDNPILTNREDVTWQALCTGHGDLFADENGNWWMVHLGIRTARRTMSHLGRETFLTPIFWKEGWPAVRNHKKARLEEEGPIRTEQEIHGRLIDEFESPEWGVEWRFIRNPDMTAFKRGDGMLQIIPEIGLPGENEVSSFVGIRQMDYECEIRVEVDISRMQEGDEAGIALYHTHEFLYRYGLRKKDGKAVLFLKKKAEDFVQTEEEWIGKENVHLVIKADKLTYCFFTEEEERNPREIWQASTRFLACEVVGRSFTGTMTGLYASALEKSDKAAVFKHFKVIY